MTKVETEWGLTISTVGSISHLIENSEENQFKRANEDYSKAYESLCCVSKPS